MIIADKMWTYCANFSRSEQRDALIKGPIFSAGLDVGNYHVRIPWLGDRRPKAGRPVKCYKCGDFVENGIEIKLRSGEKYGFCCDRNYYLWWSVHENVKGALPDYFSEYRDGSSECPKDMGKPVNGFLVDLPESKEI